ncbi:hypothetical protein BCEP4_1100004 [Burkholderia cepacia]|nr:hypothetical protein BCEP4_1100004 [Burkholderia cepacia]
MVATHRYRTKGQPRLPFFVSARRKSTGRRPGIGLTRNCRRVYNAGCSKPARPRAPAPAARP